MLDLMREIILATDLQHHFDILTALTSMAESKSSTILNASIQTLHLETFIGYCVALLIAYCKRV